MRTWQHSHNLRETTRDRLESVVRELRAERAAGASRKAPEPELQRIDQALSLLQQALAALAG